MDLAEYGSHSRFQFSNKLETLFQDSVDFRRAKKGEHLLREGQMCDALYYLQSGTVRTYYIHDAQDVTSWFYRDGYFFTAWHSFYGDARSYEYIEVLEESEIMVLKKNEFEKLIQQEPDFATFARILAEEQTAFLDQYFKGYMFLSAKERYQLLLEFIPDIELRSKLGNIASFLGISQETLSRIRAGK
ncbi:MAG: Crp/Fnr family transcriptional regulator [Schleiferiaceae bacterium]|jgi:CRP-like cAMP-binding protein|nr:Crp/Fnr family transcriptional regulator [Schleiferiaceae bacterium]